MKTLGEILKAARLQRHLEIEKISQETKIEPKYIEALEKNDYQNLPSPTFTKGFIRNYATVLNKDPQDLIAIYRRDYKESQAPKPNLDNILQTKPKLNLPFGSYALIALGFLTFSLYLAFQYRAVLIPPPLEIQNPIPKAVVTSPVTIEGKTSVDSLITINQDTTIKPDQSGIFLTELNFAPGTYDLEIEAANRFSRKTKKTLSITVISKE